MLTLTMSNATMAPKVKAFALLHKALLLTNTTLRVNTIDKIAEFDAASDVTAQARAVQDAADALADWGFPKDYRDQVILRSLMPERTILGATESFIADDYTASGCTSANVQPAINCLATKC